MGGLLFGTPRMPVNEFKKYRKNIESIMDFYNIEYRIPLYFREKEDFGDLDVIIKDIVPVSQLLKIFKSCECYYDSSESEVSFNFRNFQIDFIRVKPEYFDTSFYYYSYNDLGNLIGQLARTNYLKYGFDGLKYNHYDNKKQKLGSILISKNINKILLFLDLDPATYNNGFNNLKEEFDFIIKSKFFNPYVSDLEPYGISPAGVALYRTNKVNRERNSKRKTFIAWLDYIEKYKIGEEQFLFREDVDINDVMKRINKFFPECNFEEKLTQILKKDDDKKRIKKKFNGNIIIELIPNLKKEDRQLFIDSFRSDIIKKYKDFTEYIINSSQEKIKEDILKFFIVFKNLYK